MRKAGRVCVKVELEVGGCCPGQMGWCERARNTGACALCTLRKGATVKHQKHKWSTQRDPGPKRKGQGRRKERVLQQHSRASTWPRHSRTRASGKRSLSPCLEQQKHTIATRGVDYGGAACTAVCVAACNLKTARPSTAEGLVAWVHRNPTTSHSHPMVLCMTAKTTDHS